jgi:putative transposase
VKYAWIENHRNSFPITVMCRVLQVSKSGYYASRSRGPSDRQLRNERIRNDVKTVYDQSREIYGSYKIADRLQNDAQLESACRNTVAKAMREMGLKSNTCKRFRQTTTVTDPSKTPAANLLNQVFQADKPNRKWVTDITYLPTAVGFIYLAVVLDLFSRKVVGWAISDSLATPLVSSALKDAITRRRPETKELLHHSDRGCQYTSDQYQQTLKTLGITCSMSRTGCCYDNAVMERFFWSLKHEWTNHRSFSGLSEARASVFEYIEAFYNSVRIHQTLGYRTPDQFEEEYQTNTAV